MSFYLSSSSDWIFHYTKFFWGGAFHVDRPECEKALLEKYSVDLVKYCWVEITMLKICFIVERFNASILLVVTKTENTTTVRVYSDSFSKGVGHFKCNFCVDGDFHQPLLVPVN